MKKIAILGSTGSIGTQALDVVRANPLSYSVSVLTAHSNIELLVSQALEFNPELVVITDESKYAHLKAALPQFKVACGMSGLEEAATYPEVTLVLTAIVGAVGLKPTLAAIDAGKDIALANKETLVMAGQLVMEKARQKGVQIIPVDSEHSAIFQCLVGESENPIEKIYLTASGGPFRGKTRAELAQVTKAQALKHPNWVMGAKITIDSASLMNKGLEAIEAKWLFDLAPSQVDVIVHPQSIIHSLVQFEDGSMKAQMGLPDMKLPIHYAFSCPLRKASNFERFNFLAYPELTFAPADTTTFRNLSLAYQAMEKGGNMPSVLNAANEVVVEAFLNDQLSFLAMSDVIQACMEEIPYCAQPELHNYLESDQQTRIFAREFVTKQKNTNPIN
ncbi:MAG: 1-deoxy-D-xylulose-5-phosphate reductoisomerase [Pedobacter sp.]|nr:MAG: 1-deoxy-D-xylulose-5-phosphate reductoisomerase [Pedobacter sp.]